MGVVKGLVRRLACVSLVLVPGVAAGADVVVLVDGRTFEGTVLRDNPKEVKIDTVVATIRTQLTFGRAEIDSVTLSPLPDDFFSPAPGEVSSKKRSDFADDATLYVTVPVVGVVGKDVLAVGVRRTLAYAQRNGIQHVVFDVNSDGGSIDETLAIAAEMKKFEGILHMHALVRRCTGDALAVPMLCDTVTLTPTAVVGGSSAPMAEGSDAMDSDLDLTLRSDLARRAAEASIAKGRPGVLIRAAIDPTEVVAVWTDEQGQIQVGRELPEGVPAESVIAEDGPDTLLVLDGPQLKKLGAPVFDVDIAGLGEVLHLDGWTSESGYGAMVMEGATNRERQLAERKEQAEALRQAQSDTAIKRNIQRREAADRTLQNAVQQAALWDPANQDYATYQSSYHWWSRSRYGTRSDEVEGTRDTNRLTRQSRTEWRQRTDATMGYLSQGAKAARSLQKLDEEAAKLGLEPTYKEGELATIIQDLEVKWNHLSSNRNKKEQ